jgi:acyl-coenzyme A synthetase/AMP-(fatty) acid ligase
MTDNSNYGLAVLELGRQFPDREAFRFGDNRHLTLGALCTLATRYALNMRARGIDAGSCLALNDPSRGLPGVALALASALIGCRWVQYRPDIPIEAVGLTHVLAVGRWPSVIDNVRSLAVDERWGQLPDGTTDASISEFGGFASPDSIAMYGSSSGTTGTSKYIARSCGYILNLIRERSQTTDFRSMSIRFPYLFAPGFRLLLGALLEGRTVVVGEDIATLARLDTEAVYGSPAQIETLIKNSDPLPKRLKYLRIGGASINATAVRRWLGYFERVEAAYGSRDGGGAAATVISQIAEGESVTYTPYEGVEIQIVDPQGKALPADTEGEIRLRTPFTVAGYVGDADATAEAFRDGWFHPGDVGSLSEDGRLTVIGRIKDQINIGGVKFNASLVDEAAASAPGVIEAAAFVVEGRTGMAELCVLAVARPGVDLTRTAAAIREATKAKGRRATVPQRIYFASALPQNSMSKVMRSEAAAQSAALVPY